MADIWMDVDTALSEVPVNLLPLVDDTDFKTREEAVAYNATGMELIWHFTTPAGATTATVVTPTTGGAYDWAHQDGAMYTIEMPASGGASANNDTEGFGWFTGKATGILPWRGPVIGFRAAGLNDALIESAWSATRGLAGTALPAAAADAAGGLPISDAGALDLDAKLAATNEVTAARMGALTDWINGGRLDLILDIIAADVVNLDGAAMRGTDNAALASGVTVTTNNDKTGYALTATTGLGNQTADITGSLSGTVGGIAGTITTLDALDTAQDTQHGTTQTSLTALRGTISTLDALLLKVRKYAMLLARADAAIVTDAATELSELNADLASGAGDYSPAAESLEAAAGAAFDPATDEVDADVKKINATALTGVGTALSPWGPA